MNRTLLFTFAVVLPVNVFAQQVGAADAPKMDHGAHMAHSAQSAAQPKEPGQDAFAAIQEIVALLEADASTDWSKVNITVLQRHLIDMNNVTLFANVTSEPVAGGARYTVTGTTGVRDSIRRMVGGHAGTMSGVGGWQFAVKEHPDGVTLTVTTSAVGELAKLRAHGFIGAMTRGVHHQTHHLAIASGRGPHE